MAVKRKYILLIECYAKRILSDELYSSAKNNKFVNMEIELPCGSLLEEIKDFTNSALRVLMEDDPNSITLRSIDYKDVYLTCLKTEVEEITTFETEVLIPVRPFSERLRLYMHGTLLEDADYLAIDDVVKVELDSHSHIYQGILRYKGTIQEKGNNGIYFGVELKGYKVEGGCDGNIGAKRYFCCAPKTGLFLTIANIKPVKSYADGLERKPKVTLGEFTNHQSTTGSSLSKSKSSLSNKESTGVKRKTTTSLAVGNRPKPPLSVDDRVVWISDDGPEYGIVRWIGNLPDAGDDLMVGVEFDNPVGTGTGNYNDLQLFETAVNHAAIVPIMGLIKAEDFSSSPDVIHNLSDSKQKRDAKSSSSRHISTIPSNQNNLPSSMFVPHEDHPLSKATHPEISHHDNVGSNNTMYMSKESLPYMPHLTSKYVSPREVSPGMPYSSNYSRNNANTSSSLPGYETEICNTVPDCTNNVVDPKHNSPIKPVKSRYDRLCRSAFGNIGSDPSDNQMHHEFAVQRYSHPSSTLPSYSSRTVYPSSTSDCDTLFHQECCASTPTSYTLTSRSPSNVNSLPYRSSSANNTLHHKNLVSSCPEMDSGSFYHVVHDECANPNDPQNVTVSAHTSSLQKQKMKENTMLEDIDYENDIYDLEKETLEVGSVVEVVIKGEPHYGLIKWIGSISEYHDGKVKIAGIELEEETPGCTDGTFNGYRLFDCPPRKGFFVQLNKCRKDSRFSESDSIIERPLSAEFGSMDCPVVSGDIPPLSQPENIRSICGKYRGIQGHHNSCYLDATLFSMFSFTPVFDCILHRPSTKNDIEDYSKVQQVLKEEIVNPLRSNMYVRADRVMKLRKLLDELSSVSGLTSEEKDPEEFLNSLLNQIMKAEPFLKLSSGQESFFYQLFVEKDEKIVMPTVQQLFDQSFLTSDIKLKEVPSCLLIQMPRFGKQFKMYPRIIPSPYLDITDVLEDSPRQCSICGQVAEFECKECYRQFGEGLESTAFCSKCLEKSHCHQRRTNHKSTRLRVPENFQALKDHTSIPRIFMELYAVVCIETSHYVAFVKCGTGPDAPWCFFDSMADRKGEQNGYNIPEVVPFKDLKWWLSEEGFNHLLTTKDDKNLPEMPKRLLCDAYMCFYQSPDVMMYR